MKKVLLVLLLCVSVNSYAQLKVKGATSKVVIGPDRVNVVDDSLDELTCSIFGHSLDSFRPGAKLGFGDFGVQERYGWNVFIGEFGEYDSDKLWLHGKNGFNFTISNADYLNHKNHMLISYDVADDLGLKVNTEILAQGFKMPANMGDRDTVHIITDAYDRVLNIAPLTYRYIPFRDSTMNSRNSVMSVESKDDDMYASGIKERQDYEFFVAYDYEKEHYAPVKNGFDPDQLSLLFPELVSTDTLGNQYIDYIGLIPVLVSAIQEQAMILQAQGITIRSLNYMLDSISLNDVIGENDSMGEVQSKMAMDSNIRITSNAFIYQNTPNPFTTSTEISYFLPEGTQNAYIYIFDMQGAMLLTNHLTTTGFGSITINGSTLNPGMYMYSLFIDGQEIQTKKMLVTY